MKFSSSALSVLLLMAVAIPSAVDGFLSNNFGFPNKNIDNNRPLSSLTASDSELDLGMTPELKRVTDAFAAIEQEQVRYKQLLYMAQTTKEANDMPESSKTPENKVPGCLSTVFVDGTAVYNEEVDDYVINFLGDSDGLMTKGLVALLVRCLSGNTAEAIQKVDPQFIKIARIDQSLTPGRNNGFLNMLQSMKNKATELDEGARSGATSASTSTEAEESSPEEEEYATASEGVEGPKYTAIVAALQALQPESLAVVDNSQANGSPEGAETHFELNIVASAFDGLNVIKRQQLVFMMLGTLMPDIESLQIASMFTPEEAEARA
mmetsp:Transcript_7782/g.16729  ORF Transcript_7782/g.16729 Transcript_7782/m.16729 type:complete len:322 (-) Transcript_7782:401-1366(-)|eukprot:CAMPEP_0201205426 /NCGR_PEP_ID=MMETSP0851-20130426/170834_1 /ASSEMBLY_ACC=CAM_ASM_000631 /TAXON_ID=183588 /ORGANISM="Pseudo-nitzschia fraudulenta, Strain WWA7" /LENGTH=321 /DNA_ID=CAMNT_0047493659 /DNA_START=121 /DNA_END=1086 /DNA_ORIENTATION=-